MRFRADLEKKSFDRSMKTTKTALAFGQLEKGLTELLESGDWQKYLKVQSKFHNYRSFALTENKNYAVKELVGDNCSKINSRATFKESSLWREYQDSIVALILISSN